VQPASYNGFTYADGFAQPSKHRAIREGRAYQDFRWSSFKNFEARDMFTVVSEQVFPWLPPAMHAA
jgi:hypothetical protein